MLRKLSIWIILLITLAGITGLTAFLALNHLYESQGRHDEDVIVLIEPGASVSKIAQRLDYFGVIDNQFVFRLGVRMHGISTRMKAGEYRIPAKASMESVAATLVSGEVIEHRLTIPEGLTTREVLNLINGDSRLGGGLVQDVPEGALLPETYQFTRGTDRKKLISRLQKAQSDFLSKVWPLRAKGLPYETQAEAIILASIIEKETGFKGERHQVASVFVNRMRKSMPLQSDPTVIYALTEGKRDLGRNLTRLDWKYEHPYNTYVHAGLPPGPIANPGVAAISAALQPAETEFLYFVADGTGGHAFSRSLKEHNKNVQQWRKFKKENGG